MIIVFHSTDVIPFLECFILDGMRIFGIPSKQFIHMCGKATMWPLWYIHWWWLMVVSLSECQLISLFVGFWRLSNKNRSSLKTSSEVFGKSLYLRTVLSLKNGQESYSTTTTDTKARFAYHISLSFRKYTTNILSTQLSFSFCLMYWGRLGGLKRMIW